MTRLVFIGGAPGVGKSTVAQELLARLEGSVWLNGDDLWRMRPFVVNERTKGMVEENILFVLRSFLRAGFPYVLFTWVLHDQSIIDRLLSGLRGESFQFSMFTLLCDEPTLVSRLFQHSNRTTDVRHALERLRQTRSLGGAKIDTVDKGPRAVAEEILANLLA